MCLSKQFEESTGERPLIPIADGLITNPKYKDWLEGIYLILEEVSQQFGVGYTVSIELDNNSKQEGHRDAKNGRYEVKIGDMKDYHSDHTEDCPRNKKIKNPPKQQKPLPLFANQGEIQ